jgi:hypothetical protein
LRRPGPPTPSLIRHAAGLAVNQSPGHAL